MRLSIIAFGRLRNPGMAEAAGYFRGLLKSFVPAVQEIELKAIAVPDKSPATRMKVQEKEAELLLAALESAKARGGRGAFYLLDEGGKELPTRGWAELVRGWERDGIPELAICVGSSLGFGESLRREARGRLSLGPQTLPHELARVVLLEQLYRAWSVTRGHPYHNEGC